MFVRLFYLALLYVLLVVIPNVHQYIYSRCRSHQVWRRLRRRCKYVLVFGATTGIGKALTMRLAKRGMKIVLVGRDETTLSELQNEIGTITECHMYIANCSRGGGFSFVDEHDIGMLVNCVNTVEERPLYFVEQPIEESLGFYLTGTMLLTRRVIANMMECGFGYVLTLGSLSVDSANPLSSVPGSIASSMRSLSESLYYELEEYNVHVEYIGIGDTASNDRREGSFFIPRAETLAESILCTFGSGKISVPYLPHFLQYLLQLCIPSALLGRLSLHEKKQRIRRLEEVSRSESKKR